MPPPQPHKNKKAEETDEDEIEIEMEVNGVTYFFRKSDMTSRHELELYQQSGLTLGKLVVALDPIPTPFAIAGLMFLSIKQLTGDPINRKRAMKARYEKILASLNYTDMDINIIGADDDDEDEKPDEDVTRPEAEGDSGEDTDQSSPTGSD